MAQSRQRARLAIQQKAASIASNTAASVVLAQRLRVGVVQRSECCSPRTEDSYHYPQCKGSESKFPAELKNTPWEGLCELAKTAAADVINAKSAEAAPVRLVESVKGISLELQCHTLSVKMEQLSE